MATPELPVGYFDEGRAYLDAVETLGLRPNAFFWAFDSVTNGFVLVLITEAFDAVGPLALSEILFKAYNAQATPRAIDPFIIRLHSTQHQIVYEMDRILPFSMHFRPDDSVMKGEEEVAKLGRAVATIGGLEIDGEWVYVFDKPLTKKHSTTDVLRRWHRFERTINKMAA